jgi:hypothetical protein
LSEEKYTQDGYLIVSETDTCPLWEQDTIPCRWGCRNDCFFCRFADFRTEKFIRNVEDLPRGEELHSVCHNEKNKKKETESDG